jgi:hypothetical protein
MKARFSPDGAYIYTINLTYESFRVYQTSTLNKVGAIQQPVGTGKFVVYQDRAFVEQETGGNALNIINVTNPALPFVDTTVSTTINDMAISGGKLYLINNDSVVVYDVDDHHFMPIAWVALESNQDAMELAVFYDTVFVFITQKGLVKYQLLNDTTGYSLSEMNTFALPYGEPDFMAVDTFGLYLSYRTNGLFSCNRQTLMQKGYYRGELDTKGYVNQYGVQDLFCKDNLIFLVEYFSQTTILTNNNNFSFGINDNMPESTCRVLVYPNPFSDQATIRIISPTFPDEWNMVIYDLTGCQILKIENIHTSYVTVKRGHLKGGMYVYQVTDKKGLVASGKIILY